MFGINKTFKKELQKNYTQQFDGANIQTTEFMKVPGMTPSLRLWYGL